MDLEIELKKEDGPYYEQIYRYIRDLIRSGSLEYGEKLPSTRSLANFLHISRTTTALAYEQLQAEGYLESRGGSGNYVCGPDILPYTGSDPEPSAPAVRPDQGVFLSAMEEEGKDVIDFSPRKIDMSCFPYPTWRRILRQIMTEEQADIFSMGDPMGDLSLRQNIAHSLKLSRNVDCHPSQIIIGAGSDYNLLLLRQILGEGQAVAMENPTYSRAAGIFESQGYEVTPVRMDSSGMSAKALGETDCTLAYLMPARQYPTGIVMPYTRRMELLDWAQAAPDRYLIEDDYDSQFRYQGKPLPSLKSLDRRGRVIYMGSFSKTIAPGVRISFLVLPDSLTARYHENCRFLSNTVSRIDQCALDAFIQSGSFERYQNRMRIRYRAKHDLLVECLRQSLPGFRILGSGGGLHILLEERDATAPKGSTPLTSSHALSVHTSLQEQAAAREEELALLAKERGVIVHPISHLVIRGKAIPEGQRIAPQLILGFASLTEDQIQDGVARLVQAWT